MRKIIASTYTTLDGYIDNPHLWSMRYMDDEAQAYTMELTLGADALLLGRVTYEGMAQAWPTRGGNPFADHVNSMAKYAVSSTLDSSALAAWDNSNLIRGDDLVTEVTKLKEQPGGNILTGAVAGSPTRSWSTASSTSIGSASAPSSAARGSASSAKASPPPSS
jgi:dihydrofolate reductase